MVGLALLCCLVGAHGIPASVTAGVGAGKYSASSWEIRDRLALNKLNSIFQTHDGYLWLATLDGLGRYDGVNIKFFDKNSTPALPNPLIACLFEDRAGALWIGGDNGGITRMSHDRFERIAMPAAWSPSRIERILEDQRGTLWILNHAGEIAWLGEGKPGGIISSVWLGHGKPMATALIGDSNGTVWSVRGRSLVEASEREAAGQALELPTESPNPVVFPARAGGFWVADGKRVRRWANGQWAEDRGTHGWTEVVSGLPLETASGVVLIPTSKNSLVIIDPEGAEAKLSGRDMGGRDPITCLYEDQEGIVWLGTAVGGLSTLRPRVVAMLEPPDHWLGQAVVTVAPKNRGGLFIGTQAGAIYHYDQGLFTGLSRIRDESASAVRCLWEDAANSLWVGTQGAGLWQESQGVYQRAGFSNGSPSQISAIFQSKSGDLWFGTDEGPVQLHNGKLRYLAREFSIPHADTRCFAEGPDGAIWIGMQGGGLGRFTGGQWLQFSPDAGLADANVWSLLADAEGKVWVGTYGAGLYCFTSGKFSSVSTRNGLPSDVICSMVDDQRGNLWMSSMAGVFRVNKDALSRCAEGRAKAVDCQVLGLEDGLASLEFSGGGQPSACRTADGRLWFPCSKGLAMIDPQAARNDYTPPPAALQELVIDGESVDLESWRAQPGSATEAYEIGPGRHHVEIRYAGLCLSSPEHVRFRYRMRNLEKDWLEAGGRRSAYYSYLPSGQYVFEAVACSPSGVWGPSSATLSLRVRAYFWQTWWFLSGTAFLGMTGAALAATGISRRREQRRREEMERQQASEAERTRIARDIHDQLGIGLTRISMLSLSAASRQAKALDAQRNVEEIQRTTAELTRSMDEIVWAVNPRHDTLDSLLTYLGEFARKFLETAEIRCRLALPLEVPEVPLSAESRHHVFLAFQEALNNVVKHASATEVHIVAEVQTSQLILSVEDNGKGFSRSKGQNAGSAGNGLLNMEDRLRGIGGGFDCESSPGTGTKIRMIIPIKR